MGIEHTAAIIASIAGLFFPHKLKLPLNFEEIKP